jgi:hypothetical protein
MAQLIQANPLGAFLDRRQQAQTHGLNQQLGQQKLDAGELNQQLGQQRIQAGALSQRAGEQQFGSSQDLERTKFLNNAGKALLQIDESQWPAVVDRILPQAQRLGVPVDQLDLSQMNRQNIQELVSSTSQFLSDPSKLTAAQQEFASLTEGFSEEEQSKARRVKAGLAPRATGSAIQTIAEAGTGELVADTEQLIAGRKEFGKLTGSSRAKTIDTGFDKIAGIDNNIRNIDRAIAAIDSGAGTGAVESRFFPSIKAASVELDQIQGELALDVIGAVTFGALSEGELNLAKDIALPSKLNEVELKDFLTRKKDAQTKLRGYYEEQIEFLDQGGTVAGFLREKRRGQPAQAQQAPQQQTQAAAPQQRTGGTIMVDANGNRARVFEDGSFEEL